MARIGVFVCHCGENIARTVDIEKLTQEISNISGVVYSNHYRYVCSDPGQKMIRDTIKEHNLTAVVVAACSPLMHEVTFRRAAQEAGLNPYLVEMANIREHCSWVHQDKIRATEKAKEIVKTIIDKIKFARPLQTIQVPITRRALVIGGGVSGIQAALDLAKSGFQVTLIERQPSIGGNMARLSETFPTLDCSQCILTPKMVEVNRHPNIELITYAELEEVSGYVGNFKVKIKKKPRYVIEDLCTGCGDCANVCPVSIPNEFDRGLSWRKAIYIPFPQAVPAVYTLDEKSCLGLNPLACERCSQICTAKAIDYQQKPEIIEREVGAIIVATGYELLPAEQAKEYGWGIHPDIMDGLEFERMLSASGPTNGVVKRPSDGKTPKNVVFIQCVGSRDPARGVPYCSKICCMYTAKHALLYKHKVHDGNAYIFYMDIRAGGKGFEEFVTRVMEEERVLYIRGRASRVIPLNGKLIVQGIDTLSNQKIDIEADLVVLATSIVATHQNGLDSKLKITADQFGFIKEAHPKLRPVETMTAGVFLAGAVQAPKDILESVAQASGAASKVLELFSKGMIEREPIVAQVNEMTCSGCFDCLRICPYGAIQKKEIKDKQGNIIKYVANVNDAVCGGCGACTVNCRNHSMDLFGFTDQEIYSEIIAIA